MKIQIKSNHLTYFITFRYNKIIFDFKYEMQEKAKEKEVSIKENISLKLLSFIFFAFTQLFNPK